ATGTRRRRCTRPGTLLTRGSSLRAVEPHKQAEVDSRTPDMMAREARKPFGWSHGWGAECWLQWAAVTEMLHRLAIAPPARVLDVGCGPGWTSAFLAEA